MAKEEKKVETERKIIRLRAPEKVKGTNWRERFYNEQVPVRDRIAEVRRPMNAEDLKRRGWTELDADGEKEEEKKAAEEKAAAERQAKVDADAKDKADAEEKAGEGKGKKKKGLAERIKDKLSGKSAETPEEGEPTEGEKPAEDAAPAEGEGEKPTAEDEKPAEEKKEGEDSASEPEKPEEGKKEE